MRYLIISCHMAIQTKNSRICGLFEHTYGVMPWFSNCGPENSSNIHRYAAGILKGEGKGFQCVALDPHTFAKHRSTALIWLNISFCEKFYLEQKSVLKLKVYLKNISIM